MSGVNNENQNENENLSVEDEEEEEFVDPDNDLAIVVLSVEDEDDHNQLEEDNHNSGASDVVVHDDDMSTTARREDDDENMNAANNNNNNNDDNSNSEEDDGESSSSSREDVAAMASRRSVRHSYLPGPSHPLLHDGSNSNRRNHGSIVEEVNNSMHDMVDINQEIPFNSQQPQLQHSTTSSLVSELPLLELPGIVLFPGSTIPIRLSNRSWIQYLGQQIDASRRVGGLQFGQTVKLGILTQDDWLSTPMQALRQQARNQHGRGRASLWRRGVRNSRQERAISRQLRQELLGEMSDSTSSSDDDDDDDGDVEPVRGEEDIHNNSSIREEIRRRRRSSVNSHRRNSSQQRRYSGNLHPFVGRIGTIATITYTHGDAMLDQQSNGNYATSSQVWQRHAEDQSELILQAVGTARFQVDSYLELQSFADVQVFSVREFPHDRTPLRVPRFTGWRERLPYNENLVETNEKNYPIDIDDKSNNTSSAASTTTTNSSINTTTSNSNRRRRRSSSFAGAASKQSLLNTQRFRSYHASVIDQLAMLTPLPQLALQEVWPWRLVGQLVQQIETHSGAGGTGKVRRHNNDSNNNTNNNNNNNNGSNLLASLAELLQDEENVGLMDDPTQFSFWLASNLPLSVTEKFFLLQEPTTVERLIHLEGYLSKYIRRSIHICCARCNIPLSAVDNVFTVGGAEGTTANYVNEHGFIHQVVTVRDIVQPQYVVCVGRASTDNSYFPGYSWTMSYCHRCGSHLGWKFHWVGEDNQPTRPHSINTPPSFFGFLSSSLEMESMVT